MLRPTVLSLLALAACASPQERCISGATKDLRILSGLIASTQGNINRGYAVVTEEYFETESQVCGVVDGQDVYCDVAVPQTREVPKAIDLNAEQAKLQSLLEKQGELRARSRATIAECKRQHPEG